MILETEIGEGPETTVKPEYGRFPSTAFFLKWRASDVVVDVDENKVVLRKLDFGKYKSQLWIYKDGLLLNKDTELALGVTDGNQVVVKRFDMHSYGDELA